MMDWLYLGYHHRRTGKHCPAAAAMLLLIAGLLFASSLFAKTGQLIAVFPLLDLSRGPNGINYTISEQTLQAISERGFTVVDEKTLMDFMVRHRIRTLSHLTSYQVSLLHKELKADLVMLGAISELKENSTPAISISLQLIRCTDARIVWAKTENLYYADMITLLGIHDPESMDDLYAFFFKKLFQDMPEKIATATPPDNKLDVATVSLYPTYVRPGEDINCKIKLHTPIAEGDNRPSIMALVAGKEYPLTLDEDGYYFTASWPASDEAGEKTVSLRGKWPGEKEVEIRIGTYTVDDHPPKVELHLGAKEINGEAYFNDKLAIIPLLVDPEPITRWEITVIDEQGETIVRQSAAEHVPRRLTWRGQTSQGSVALDGDYHIVFKVWDRAGWSASAETDVLLKRQPPEISLEVRKDEERLQVTIEDLAENQLAFWWAKFFAGDGHPITVAEGESMPASVVLDLAGDKVVQGVECIVLAQDIYGNRTRQDIKNLGQLIPDTDQEEILQETEWVEEF